jgi:hypothetical protein
MSRTITINRAPVLTLWAAVVAERLGFDWDEALTLGRAVAGITAYSKGTRLGIFEPTPAAVREKREEMRRKAGAITIALLGRGVPAVHTPHGLRALDKGASGNPASVERYLASKFGDALKDTTGAMRSLARSLPPSELAAKGFDLYVRFRPGVPEGESGWGAKGKLELGKIVALAKGAGPRP